MNREQLKRVIVRRILIAFALFLLAITAVVLYSFRQFTIANVQEKSVAVGELVLAGLTAHMRNGTMDERGYFLSEIAQMQGVGDLWVVRSESVNRQFGAPIDTAFERTADAIDRAVFAEGKVRFELDEFGTSTARVSIPYVARSDAHLNCLACHHVPEGTVLGILNVQSPIDRSRQEALLYGLLVALLTLLFVGVMIFGSIRLTDRFVIRPLHKLVALVETGLGTKKPIEDSQFRTADFAAAASQFNRMLAEVDEKQGQLESLNNEIEETLRETIFTLATVGERKCEETGNHVRRVQHYCQKLGQLAGLPQGDVELLKTASALHDIGKVAISEAVLKKPARLDEREYSVVKQHAHLGYEMLRHSNRDVMRAAAVIAGQHHERFDGRGYPAGLAGEAIHIFGRIAAIADVFDALISDRCYKKAWHKAQIYQLFLDERGKQFDPALTDIFLAHFDDFVEISQTYRDDNFHNKDS